MLGPIVGQTKNNFRQISICFLNMLHKKSASTSFYSPTASFVSFASLFISSPMRYAA